MENVRCFIDVGGCLYVSTFNTLCKSPALKKRLETECHTSSDGTFAIETTPFIDRDGHAFAHILNFLRNGTIHISTDDRAYIEFLMGEASFYGLRAMESQLSRFLTEPPTSIQELLSKLCDSHIDVKALLTKST